MNAETGQDKAGRHDHGDGCTNQSVYVFRVSSYVEVVPE